MAARTQADKIAQVSQILPRLIRPLHVFRRSTPHTRHWSPLVPLHPFMQAVITNPITLPIRISIVLIFWQYPPFSMRHLSQFKLRLWRNSLANQPLSSTFIRTINRLKAISRNVKQLLTLTTFIKASSFTRRLRLTRLPITLIRAVFPFCPPLNNEHHATNHTSIHGVIVLNTTIYAMA